jgi:hypothetical protein
MVDMAVLEDHIVLDMAVLRDHIVLDMAVLRDHIVLNMLVLEDGLAFYNIPADNIEIAEYMFVNIVAGSIVIVNIVDIGIDNHSQSLDMLLGIHIRSLKDSHHILVGHNYID